jgi:hypothetical protein
MNILLDSTGDWDVQSGSVQFTTGKEEIAQMIAIRLKTFVGEWFLDVEKGLPYFSTILVKNPNSAEIENLFISEIASTPGVLSIDEFAMTYDNTVRKLTVNARISSVGGVINFSQEVP